MSATLRQAGSVSLPILSLVALWQGLSSTGLLDPQFLPSPLRVVAAGYDLFVNDDLLRDLETTLISAGLGLLLGIVIGVPLCALMALSPWVEAAADPLVKSTYSLPKTALVPLFILWFGVGGLTNILTVASTCLLPLVIYTYHGLNDVPRVLIWSARSLGTPSRLMLWRLYFPSAQHSILISMRLSVSLAFILSVASEMIVANAGMGKAMFLYGENGSYDYMFAAAGVTIGAAFLADRLMVALGNYWLRWAEPAQRMG